MNDNYKRILKQEIQRIDEAHTSKRNEKIIEGYENHRAIINDQKYMIFNSNDYLGLRLNKRVNNAEEAAVNKFGSGPGAVRFISGTLAIHKKLEKALADFHGREDAMVFSSAFAANLAVLHCVIKGQSKDSLVNKNTLVISDQLNHRSIIDGIRVAGLPREHKLIFKHLDLSDLDNLLEQNKGKFTRVLVVTDGIFSMLGEYQNIGEFQSICEKHENSYEQGIITVVDDSHGVACYGATGRGCEEKTNGKCDILLGTLGKGFGSDGGYIVGDKLLIDYLRESAATYIYSNSISPGTAAAALESIKIINSEEGKKLLDSLNDKIKYFKEKMIEAGFEFACDSDHPIQAVLIGDAEKTKQLTAGLYKEKIIVTNINYPVVPKGRDEIRVQLSAAHTKEDIDEFLEKIISVAKEHQILQAGS